MHTLGAWICLVCDTHALPPPPIQGPHFPEPLLTPDCLDRLNHNIDQSLESLQYVMRAITLTRHKLDGACPLFGFTGAPWTLMSYMIEGGGSSTHSKSKAWLYRLTHGTLSLSLSLRVHTIYYCFVGIADYLL